MAAALRSTTTLLAVVLLLLLLRLGCCATFPSSGIGDDILDCGPRLLLLRLAACLPFVQGIIPSPAQPCCDNMIDLYTQQPKCLCVLLNDTTALPVNQTLVLLLPLLCGLKSNISSCPGMIHLPPTSPGLQVPDGSDSNSSNAAAPIAASAPVLNLYHSGSNVPQTPGGGASLVIALSAIALMKVFSLYFPHE